MLANWVLEDIQETDYNDIEKIVEAYVPVQTKYMYLVRKDSHNNSKEGGEMIEAMNEVNSAVIKVLD